MALKHSLSKMAEILYRELRYSLGNSMSFMKRFPGYLW